MPDFSIEITNTQTKLIDRLALRGCIQFIPKWIKSLY